MLLLSACVHKKKSVEVLHGYSSVVLKEVSPICPQMVVNRGVEVMEGILGWDTAKTLALLQACEAELNKRILQVQAVHSIRSNMFMGRGRESGEKSMGEGPENVAQIST